MQDNIYTIFFNFIEKHQKNEPSSIQKTQLITSQRISIILYGVITQYFPESTSFANDYFKQVLNQVAQAILNIVYRKQQIFVNIDQLVTYINIVQFIIHNQTVQLPKIIKIKLQKYIYSLLYLQNCLKIKSIYQDSLNSVTNSSFYKSVYTSTFQFRYKQLLKNFGIEQKSNFLAVKLLREIIEKNEFDIEIYESSMTLQWIILSLIYFILAAKYENSRQIPVLSKIVEKYQTLHSPQYAFRKINGLQLCHFYNNFVVDRIKKTQAYEIDRMIDEITVNNDAVSKLIVSPIISENNTILDNVIFSSSWEP